MYYTEFYVLKTILVLKVTLILKISIMFISIQISAMLVFGNEVYNRLINTGIYRRRIFWKQICNNNRIYLLRKEQKTELIGSGIQPSHIHRFMFAQNNWLRDDWFNSELLKVVFSTRGCKFLAIVKPFPVLIIRTRIDDHGTSQDDHSWSDRLRRLPSSSHQFLWVTAGKYFLDYYVS
jgi:hypothetical protein